jgi:altronate dehydratase
VIEQPATTSSPLGFDAVGRLPAPGDNAAIATRRLDTGTTVSFEGRELRLGHTVLEGHRFAIRPIGTGERLLSWGLPFGEATSPIAPGDYLCNQTMLDTLRQRNVEVMLPDRPNFTDYIAPYRVDEASFRPGLQVPKHHRTRTFAGFRRSPSRGVGTRNAVVVLGTTSLTASFARTLAGRFAGAMSAVPNVDGVVPVAHTEGGSVTAPNNRDLLLRTLAGFVVNPNVGALLAVDVGTESIDNSALQAFLREGGYPIDDVPHAFISLTGDYQRDLARGETIVEEFLDLANRDDRSEQSVDELRIGLQCGGSDAFSGVSANPLVGRMARELIRFGGSANLAETDELIGAEPYVLANVRDLRTAERFLQTIARFRARAADHGHSAEGNPSGGNRLRGLYNIAIKSIGAARKKDPEIRLDYVIDYGERMADPGFYFMDSPGNDLESVAGQVAAGCNVILFTTGNGSITNFPFVPTLKIVTTTARFDLLSREMDIDAGRYLHGTPMDALGAEAFDLIIEVCSGRRCAGEQAGHSQVSIWRNWAQRDGRRLQSIAATPRPTGRPLRIERRPTDVDARFDGVRTERGVVSDRIGLIAPTSICSGQVATRIAEQLTAGLDGLDGLSRVVALVHTEGCGVDSGYSEGLFLRTMLGHVTHPLVRSCLLLEHGCEKTHNDAVRGYLAEHGVDGRKFGWASIQLDGGIDAVTDKVVRWFTNRPPAVDEPASGGLDSVRLGVTASGDVNEGAASGLAALVLSIAASGGTVVLPEGSGLLRSAPFCEALGVDPADAVPTISYGEVPRLAGLHVMECPTEHAVEVLTGLGATGVEVMVAHVAAAPLQSHPMIPLLQVSSDPATIERAGTDLDLVIDGAAKPDAQRDAMLEAVCRVLSREYAPRLFAQGNVDFQLTRGHLGVSL